MVLKYIDTAGIAFAYANNELEYFLDEILPSKEDFKSLYLIDTPLVDDSDEYHLPVYESIMDLTFVSESRSGYYNESEVPENLSPHEMASVAAFLDKKTLKFNLYNRQGNYIFFHHRSYRSIFEIDISKFSMPSSNRTDPYFTWQPRVIVFRNQLTHQTNVTNYIRARYQQILEERIARLDKQLGVYRADELVRQKMSLQMMVKRAMLLKLEDSKFQPKPFYMGEYMIEYD